MFPIVALGILNLALQQIQTWWTVVKLWWLPALGEKHIFTMLSITVSPDLQSKAEIGESNLTSLSCQTYGELCPLLPNNTYLAFSMPDMPLSGMMLLQLNSDVNKQVKSGVNCADLKSDQKEGGVLRASRVAPAGQGLE